jgi:hypothetical protein
MGLFKRQKPTNHSVRSAEQLPASPHVDNRGYSTPFEYNNQNQQPVQPVQSVQPTHSLSRSQSQRNSKILRDRPTVNIVSDERRDKNGLLARPSSGILERSVSFRGKTISNPISQPTSPRLSHPETLNETDEGPHIQHSYSENPSPVTAPQFFESRAAPLAYQQQHSSGPRPSHPAHNNSSQAKPAKLAEPAKPPVYTQPLPSPIQRLNTDSALEQYTPSNEIPESPRYQDTRRNFTPVQDPVLNLRPPSQQTLEPLSPLLSVNPDAMQSQAQAPAQPQFQSDKQSAGSPQQDRSRPGSVSNNMPENGRSTPTNAHRREDSGEIDVRALIQKHDELRKDIWIYEKFLGGRNYAD